MDRRIKRITFVDNPFGYQYLDVDMNHWQIVGTCPYSTGINKRAFRLVKRGKRVEYRDGSEYREVPADIKSIK